MPPPSAQEALPDGDHAMTMNGRERERGSAPASWGSPLAPPRVRRRGYMRGSR
jgi:hypothetical protein